MTFLIYLCLLSFGFSSISFTHGWTYHYSNYTMSYDNAQKYCREKYTDMVAIQNHEENKYLSDTLPFNSEYFWIGIRKNVKTGKWTWVGTNKELTKEAENWAPGEPNNKSEKQNEDCVEMYGMRNPNPGKWNDMPCSRKKVALCYTAACNSSSCNHHGECIETINSSRCNCSDGFFGKDCEHVVTCPEISGIDQGSAVCSHVHGNFTYQSSCHFTCPDGYLLVGSENLQCNGKGDWGVQIPHCKAIQCERPELPDNSVMDCSGDGDILPEKSTCHFTCNEGFTMVGSSSILCTTPGQWSESLPECEAIQCELPAAPENGALDCPSDREMQPYNATCHFTCDQGFILQGEQAIQCVTPDQWSEEYPECKAIQCERPELPDNSVMDCSGDGDILPEKSTCHFSCNEGFTMVGSSAILCTTPGQWSESLPECEAIQCELPAAPENGALDCPSDREMQPYNATCHFTCDQGFILQGEQSIQCVTPDQWSEEYPECKAIQCAPLTAPVNGLMRCQDGSNYNSSCAFSCPEGYELMGSSELQCLSSGEWTSSVPLCKAVQCPSLTSPRKGHMVCRDTTNYKSQCSFSCPEGFRLIGSPTLTCQSSGAWSSPVPKCEAVQCPSLVSPEDGLMICHDTTNYKSQCSFSCSEGFRLIGSPVLSCQSSGEWTSSVPRCEAVRCDALVVPSMGKMNCSRLDFGYGTVCTFTCDYDLLLNGTDTLECESNGDWNTDVPTCEAGKVSADTATYVTVGIVTSGASVLSAASLIIWLLKRMRKTAKKFTPSNSCQHLEGTGVYQNNEDSWNGV